MNKQEYMNLTRQRVERMHGEAGKVDAYVFADIFNAGINYAFGVMSDAQGDNGAPAC